MTTSTWPLTLPPCNATTVASNFGDDQKWHREQVDCELDLGHDAAHLAHLEDVTEPHLWRSHDTASA